MRLLAEGKTERFHPRFRKLDLELTVGNPFSLAHELISALTRSNPVALGIAIVPVLCTRSLTIDLHREADWPHRRRCAHDEIHVARMEAIRDPTGRRVRQYSSCSHRPISGE